MEIKKSKLQPQYIPSAGGPLGAHAGAEAPPARPSSARRAAHGRGPLGGRRTQRTARRPRPARPLAPPPTASRRTAEDRRPPRTEAAAACRGTGGGRDEAPCQRCGPPPWAHPPRQPAAPNSRLLSPDAPPLMMRAPAPPPNRWISINSMRSPSRTLWHPMLLLVCKRNSGFGLSVRISGIRGFRFRA